MMYLGDFNVTQTVRFSWNTNAIAGESITRATNGTISVYKDGNTTQSTAGVTDTEDFDSLTGVHLVAIDLAADAFYVTGADYMVVLSAATIDGKTINATLAHFSVANRSHLRPTTAGRTLDVSAGGEAGVDWANVGSPTTALNLSGTTVKTATDVETDTADIQSRLPAALVSGRIDASVGAMAANVMTAAAAAADLTTELQSGLATAASITALNNLSAAQVNAEVDTALADVGLTTTITGRIDAAVSTRLATAGYTVPPTVAAIADGVWEEDLTDHSGTAGSTAEALGAAGSAGDPWSTALPGAYGAGSAGKIIGDNLNATVGSRASQASVDTVDDFLDTEVAAIKAKTDNLPTDPADQSAVEAAITAATSGLATQASVNTIDDFLDTEVAAIKAKTDLLPATPAGRRQGRATR
jgi:hypothetical protein